MPDPAEALQASAPTARSMDNRHNSPRLEDHRSADLENLPDYHDQSSLNCLSPQDRVCSLEQKTNVLSLFQDKKQKGVSTCLKKFTRFLPYSKDGTVTRSAWCGPLPHFRVSNWHTGQLLTYVQQVSLRAISVKGVSTGSSVRSA